MNATENRVTVFQKSATCGEIRFHFSVGDKSEIDQEMIDRAERELKLHPDSQRSYYDIMLVTPKGVELDYECNIL